VLKLNLLDAVLAIVVLAGALMGVRKGLVVAGLQLFTLASSLVLAFLGYRHVADLIESRTSRLGAFVLPLSFGAAYVLCHVVLGALASAVVRAAPAGVNRAGANKALGVLPGFANGLINATVLSLLVLAVPLFGGLSSLARESAIASRLSAPAEWLEAQLAPIFDPAVQRTLPALTVQPESRASVPLPFKVADPQVRADLEARMLEMVNAERSQQGLKPLEADPELAEVARAHSRDMFVRGYFSHITPEGESPFDRMRQAHLRFLAAGENIAFARTLAAAHRDLMNSPGHRANMLRPQFGRLGVGVLDGGMRGLMITQDYRN